MKKQRTEVTLTAIFLVNLLLNAGAAFMWPLTTVYMHNDLGQTLTMAGIVLFIMSVAMIIGNYVGGVLFDRWSPYKTGLASIGLSTIAIIMLIFWHGWPFYGFVLVLIGLGDGSMMTVGNSYAATISSKSNRYVFNALYIGINLGVVVGTLLVGFLYDYGVMLVFTVMSFTYLLLFALFAVTFNVQLEEQVHNKREETNSAANKANVHMIWLICLLVFMLYVAYALWESVISVHMTSLHISFEKYSLLWTLNGLLIVTVQPFVNRIGTKFKLSSQIAFGTVIFALSFFLLVFTNMYSMFIVAMIVLTVGEMIGFPGIPAWVDDLSTSNLKGRYQGMFNMSMSFGRAVGPLFGGLMIDFTNYQTLFVTVTILMLGALALVMWRNRVLRQASK